MLGKLSQIVNFDNLATNPVNPTATIRVLKIKSFNAIMSVKNELYPQSLFNVLQKNVYPNTGLKE